MCDYPQMYDLLLNTQISVLDELEQIKKKLIKAHQKAENLYTEAKDLQGALKLLSNSGENKVKSKR